MGLPPQWLPKEVGESLVLVVLLQCQVTLALYEAHVGAMNDIWFDSGELNSIYFYRYGRKNRTLYLWFFP